jgi:hypothetical protein
MTTLSPKQFSELVDAITGSVSPDSLNSVIASLGARSGISDSSNYKTRVFQLVVWANSQGRIEDLLRSAYDANPYSEGLRRLNEAEGLTARRADWGEKIRQTAPEIDLNAWGQRLTELEKQMCVVERNGATERLTSTGFLVGPNQIMTHAGPSACDAAVIAKFFARADITISFDPVGGARQNYRALPAPLIVTSNGVIVIQLERPVGREIIVSQTATSSARARGWVTPHRTPTVSRALLILQYTTRERQLKLTFDSLDPSLTSWTLLRTSTEPGATGAPCFDENWNLLGVFVGSDADSSTQGISIESIVGELREQHLLWDVSEGIHPAEAQIKQEKQSSDLDALVQRFEISTDEHDPKDEVWTDDADEDPSNLDRWAWAEAAAVIAYFDPEELVPVGNPSVEARVAILLESSPVPRSGGKTRWLLSERVRVRALERLAKRNALRSTRAANPDDPEELLDVVLGEFILGKQPTRADRQNPDRLRAMLQVAGWLARTSLVLPSTEALRADLERAILLAPFRHLTRGFFAGRDAELAALSAYVDGPNGQTQAPILIHGPGGMGKSALLAHFILAHSERDATKPDSWRPFVYLDFDRPELDARDLSGVLLAIARQVGPQVPAVKAETEALLKRWTDRRRSQRPDATAAQRSRRVKLAPRASGGDIDDLGSELAKILLAVHEKLPAPLVLVLDTLEEVQYAAPDAVVPLAKLVLKLRAKVPSLRPVLAGRAEVDQEVMLTPLPLQPLPQAAAEALLSNHLPVALAAKTDLITRMVQIVGGNPLSLRLAAEVLSHESEESLDKLGEEELWQRVGDAIVQGQLYERTLDHLHDGPVKRLAIPGLILRYVTWELIRDVLAGPCGVDVKDDAAAQSLFSELAREIALVRQAGDETKLVLRPELRRTVLDNFRKDASTGEKRRLIHTAAVEFFSALPGPDNRAEEIYHRLWLDEDPSKIDARWLNGIEPSLRSAVEELEGRARSFLANRVGGVDDEARARNAEPAEWEAYAEKRASDLLRLGSPGAALEVLQLRTDRLPTSRLHLIESIARRSLPKPDLAAAESAASKAVEAARLSANSDEIQSALEELVQVLRLRDDTAGVLRALAQLGNLGEQLGDDLILLKAEVEGLEAIVVPLDDTAERLTETAVRVFSRLPDELIARVPELARRVAAQAGGENPTVLQRVIRLVGLGSLDKKATAGLETVLAKWAERDPGIESFVPKAPASAAELASATQYLLANRSPDAGTAKLLSEWLKTVVTPRRLSDD